MLEGVFGRRACRLEVFEEVIGQQQGVFRGQDGSGHPRAVVVGDVDSLEEDLIEHAAHFGRRQYVGPEAVARQVNRALEGPTHLVELDLASAQGALGCVQLAAHPLLFSDQMFERNCPSAVGLDQPQLRFLDALNVGFVPAALAISRSFDRLDPIQDRLPNVGGRLRRQSDRLVVTDNSGFDEVGPHPALLAGAVVVLTTDAVEVLVDLAVAVLGLREDQALAAMPTEDRPLEPVVMQPTLVAGNGVRPDDVLDAIEQLLVDERFVRALVFDAVVADDAQVVGVLEDAVDLRRPERQPLVPPGRSATQALGGQDFAQRREAVIACRVELESEPNKRRAFGIYVDYADVATVRRCLAGVEIAELGPGRGPSGLDLLFEALADLGREVATVEFRD